MVSSTDIRNASILIVDDKETNVRLLEGMLRVAGYTSVHSTTDPSKVCSLHATNRYSLILLDLQMPGLDGFQVMEGLKEIETEGYLPVLVITAQPNHKVRALETGARDFIGKPFDQAELGARVHNMLEVRLLHRQLEATVRDLEVSREVVRLNSEAEQKRNEQELALAQQTQESLLPHSLPQFDNFHVHAYNNPTRYVGGDFYDFLPLSPLEWVGVVADVSGKGMPAALLSSMVLGALSTELRLGTQPEEVLNRVNRLLCDKSLGSQFVTLFLFSLRTDGEGHFIGAGHNPAWLFRSATGKIENLASGAPILGIFPQATYQHQAFHLCKGDLLVVYSDGLADAENLQGEMLGEKKLREIVRQVAPSGSEAVKEAFLQAIGDFTLAQPQTDDITFIIVDKYL
jgi:serine phosphatase RsbU (regulator of sigma subunit)